jgi:glyoxylase-like metal-dependent hydrolase (beta-lactamase superfamily II)
MHSHHFAVGAIKLMIVADALKDLDEERITSILPTATDTHLAAFRTEVYPHLFSYNTLYLHTGSEHILVDAGTGEAGKPVEGHLLDGLAQEGVHAADIDKVIITHFHRDHIGGLETLEKTAVFPKATILVPRKEWAYWVESGQAPTERTELIAAAFAPYQGRIHFFDDGEVLAEGITARAMPGHSPGHCGLWLESGGQKLLHLADVLHTTLQLAFPELSPKFDYAPEAAAHLRRTLLAEAAATGVLTLLFHLPFPGLGYIQQAGAGFAWQSL